MDGNAVRALLRVNFKLSNDTVINIKQTSTFTPKEGPTMYNFLAVWWVNEKEFKSTLSLPELTYTSTIFSD